MPYGRWPEGNGRELERGLWPDCRPLGQRNERPKPDRSSEVLGPPIHHFTGSHSAPPSHLRMRPTQALEGCHPTAVKHSGGVAPSGFGFFPSRILQISEVTARSHHTSRKTFRILSTLLRRTPTPLSIGLHEPHSHLLTMDTWPKRALNGSARHRLNLSRT
jgi:hypothetical protein